jgi:shikimate dehydrogenase
MGRKRAVMMITGKTKIVGILGWPVGHSLSPVMHNAAFMAQGIDFSYVPLPVHPDQLSHAVQGLKSMGFVGANVTIPHKVAIMPYLDELDASAQLAGAVNTLVIKEGKCIGYNTDAQGFIQSLQGKGVSIAGKTAVIMGAGGAARAVVCGLLAHGIANITIGTRNATKAEDFVKTIPQQEQLQGCNWNEQVFKEAITQCHILINCTPIGMGTDREASLPVNWELINKNAVICDLIYNPPLTDLLAQGQKRGHVVINGAGMLIEQGALAFELWTGAQAPRDIMAKEIAKFI